MRNYTASLSSTDGQVTTEEPAKTCFLTIGPDWPNGRLCYCSAQECVGPSIRIVPSSILTSTRVTVTCILAWGRKCSCLLKTALPLVTHHLFYQPENSEMSFDRIQSHFTCIDSVVAWIWGKNQRTGSTFPPCHLFWKGGNISFRQIHSIKFWEESFPGV